MNRMTTRSLAAAAALGAAVTLSRAPASAEESSWVQVQDFGSYYLCQAAGMAAQFAGRWVPGQWQCIGPVLYLRNPPSPEN